MGTAKSIGGGLALLAAMAMAASNAAAESLDADFERNRRDLETLYQDLHRNPELSFHEVQTAARMAEALRALGFELHTNVGGHGLVGLLRNGNGPTVMLRTDLDGLPVTEQTGVPYASTVRVKDDAGNDVGTMHACGHDLHMSSWVGAARLLVENKGRWSGTLMMIAQPAEEKGAGARAMLRDGLFKKFGKPDYAVALHTSSQLPTGVVGYATEWALANVNSVDITVHGKGGHGAYPHKTIDPIVIASRIVVALQTVVARELDPIDSGVITVGSIHGGTKHNIIPNQVKLQLTVRSYKPAVKKLLLDAIKRIAVAEARAARAPKDPDVVVSKKDFTNATYNEPKLAARAAAAMKPVIGAKNVRLLPPVMGGEDFSEYSIAGVPAFIYWLGAVPKRRWAVAERKGEALPSLHSSVFAPDYKKALPVGVKTLTAIALDLFAKPTP